MEQLKRGQIIKVKAFGGEVLTRRVVADMGTTVIVSAEAEYQAAIKDGREPSGVGFPKRDIKFSATRK